MAYSITALTVDVSGMTKSAALDHASEGIRVNAICKSECTCVLQHEADFLVSSVPGLIKTPGHTTVAKEVDDMLLSKVPMARFGSPQECVDGILYLCSDLSSFCTGSTLEVDGGCAALGR